MAGSQASRGSGAVTLPPGDSSWSVAGGWGSPWPKGPRFGHSRPPGGASRARVLEDWQVGGGCVALGGSKEEGVPETGGSGLGRKVRKAATGVSEVLGEVDLTPGACFCSSPQNYVVKSWGQDVEHCLGLFLSDSCGE